QGIRWRSDLGVLPLPGGERVGVRGLEASRETLTPHPIPLPMGEGADQVRCSTGSHTSTSPRHSEPATPACCRTLAQRTVSDLTKRSSSLGEPLPSGMN